MFGPFRRKQSGVIDPLSSVEAALTERTHRLVQSAILLGVPLMEAGSDRSPDAVAAEVAAVLTRRATHLANWPFGALDYPHWRTAMVASYAACDAVSQATATPFELMTMVMPIHLPFSSIADEVRLKGADSVGEELARQTKAIGELYNIVGADPAGAQCSQRLGAAVYGFLKEPGIQQLKVVALCIEALHQWLLANVR